MAVTNSDRTRLRDLARRVVEIAALPVQRDNADSWLRHNDLRGGVPPRILIFPEGAWREIMPDTVLQCESARARAFERDLRTRLYCWEHLRDDNVIVPWVVTPIVVHQTGWGLEGRTTRPDYANGAYHIDPVIESEADIDRLEIPQIRVDWEATARQEAEAFEYFGDTITVQREGVTSIALKPLDHYAKLRGIDRMFMDLIDQPEMVHRAVARLVDGQISIAHALERQAGLTLGNGRHYVGSGGTGYTAQLPAPGFDGQHVRLRDLWGFATAQTFSEVSPEMHTEFGLQHEKRLLSECGLSCYGCCEPLHNKLEALIRHIPNLRRISIAPWADVARSAEILGDRFIFSWKPNPTVIAANQWQPEMVRRSLRAFLEQTRGCVVEIIMKDTHTCRNQPQRLWEWVRIAREEVERFAAS